MADQPVQRLGRRLISHPLVLRKETELTSQLIERIGVLCGGDLLLSGICVRGTEPPKNEGDGKAVQYRFHEYGGVFSDLHEYIVVTREGNPLTWI